MNDENLTPSGAAINRRASVAAAIAKALIVPTSLALADVVTIIEALRFDEEDHDLWRVALRAAAAILYSRADLVGPSLVDRLAELAAADSLPSDIRSTVVRLFALLATGPLAAIAWSRVLGILMSERTNSGARAPLLGVVSDFVGWCENRIGLDEILDLAESLELAEARAFVLDYGVERFVFCAPEAFTPFRLERVARLFEHAPRYRYVLHFLAARRSLPPEVRAILAEHLAGRFPLRDKAAAILSTGSVRLLVVMNIGLGQGDEIVRLAPLLQALLDTNPALAITLIARRTYLYENPRVKTVSIRDAAALDAALTESFEGVIEIFQPDRPDFADRLEVHGAVERLLGKRRPQFVISAELGRAHKGELSIRSEFLYQSVELAGQDVANSSGLDRRSFASIYEPCLRLMAELGLSQRVAEEAPLTPSILTGIRSVEAERIWNDLVRQPSTARPMPIALVNPFGGAAPSKGFLDQHEILAADIAGLVDEGYLVVVLPNGTPWGRRETVLSVLSHLDPLTRASFRVAPDPADTDPNAMLDLRERTDLVYADRVFRLFKYFTTYADLVVTVEGWLSHLAYNLGCPFRLFLAASSFTPDWFPYGRGARQQLVRSLSTRCRIPYETTELLREGDPPPFPHGARKWLLELAMSGLTDSSVADVPTALRRALGSRDSDVRRWAVVALGRIDQITRKQNFLQALHDSEPTVVAAAAEALLEWKVDCSREFGPRYRELLQIQLDVIRQNWEAVAAAGAAALPALFRAGRSGSYVLASQARSVLRDLLNPYLPGRIGALSNPLPLERPARADALIDVLRASLTRPASLNSARLAHLSGALLFEKDNPELCELGLATMAALLYSRTDLVDVALVERLTDLLTANALPEGIARAIIKLLEILAASSDARLVWKRISEVHRSDQLDAGIRDLMLPLVSEFVQWREDVVGLDEVLALAESPNLAGHRAYLFDHGVERHVFSAPEAFNPERLQQIAHLFSDVPRYSYVLNSLSARHSLPASTRAWLAPELEGRFPFRQAAASILKGHPVSLFVMMNVGMGQGDDVVRLVPLLQSLLDGNPALSITLVTWRDFLYDNPRIITIPIGEHDRVEAALAGSFDGVIEFFQPEWSGFTFWTGGHSAIERYLSDHQPSWVMKGDLGRAYEGHVGGRLSFMFQTVKLGGIEIAQSRGLDQCTVRNVYEPTMRLLAELGLPQRVAEETPLTPSVLTGTPSADAERVWMELTSREPKLPGRPVALVNPFGGSGLTKGLLEQDELLAAEISGLVDEGFLVVILPNGQAWGRRSNLDGVISRLEVDVRAMVRVAPDPAEDEPFARLTLSERPALGYGERVMRIFKYFASYADLIVTVEGWLAHLAYNLGRPFRLFLAAGSFSSEYQPRFRGCGQRLVPALSPNARIAQSQCGLLRDGDPPPLPHRPRKALLELALVGLGRFGNAGDAPELRSAFSSPDPDVRTWAITALGHVAPSDAKAELLNALRDQWPAVAREAAQALLVAAIDCTRQLGSRYRDLLQAYVDIDKQNWEAVARLGPAVLPALFSAGASHIHDVSHGAKALARQMLSPIVRDPRLQNAPPQSSSARQE